jgi:hypothetical protein
VHAGTVGGGRSGNAVPPSRLRVPRLRTIARLILLASGGKPVQQSARLLYTSSSMCTGTWAAAAEVKARPHCTAAAVVEGCAASTTAGRRCASRAAARRMVARQPLAQPLLLDDGPCVSCSNRAARWELGFALRVC